ncbi:MAG: adenylyltransferase/cytidyltransferase family protein [Elusimicrobia bacterium]|nr:adenylyltransferase/cytidyltransferase family protein [Elusimicrobiota bacterium]
MESSRDKIRTLKKILTLRDLWRWEGKKVVFTNGVFDILHAGHVELLERCRRLGDILVVGLNSDSSAKRLGKGPERPVNKWNDRAAVLCALHCIDAVVEFGEDTPAELLATLRPDILVKGGDYRKDQVAGRESAGKVVIVPLKKGYSTTSLVRRLRG